jgi:itaconate CoA-transferase
MGDSLSDAIAGIRVVALEQAVSMPFCTQILAALGADVVKIEAPGRGDVIRGWDGAVEGLSTGFVAFNVGKRDVTVDAKAPEGREILRRLAASADVFVENFSPGVAARLGLGPDELCGADSRLIYCSLSGYGQTGPYRDVKAYDLLVQGESGILLSNGTEDAPAKVGIPITDQIAGAHATIGILAALNRRRWPRDHRRRRLPRPRNARVGGLLARLLPASLVARCDRATADRDAPSVPEPIRPVPHR